MAGSYGPCSVQDVSYYTDAVLIMLYKSHVLSFVEYRTAAIYHARRDMLNRLDEIQRRFLRHVGVSELDALMDLNLAPSSPRYWNARVAAPRCATRRPSAARGDFSAQARKYLVGGLLQKWAASANSVLCLGTDPRV